MKAPFIEDGHIICVPAWQASVALAADSIAGFLQEAGGDIATCKTGAAADLAGRAALDAVVATSLAAATQPVAVRASTLG